MNDLLTNDTLTFREQVENVRACVQQAVDELARQGVGALTAERMIEANLGAGLMNKRYPWWPAADAYVGAKRQLDELLAACRYQKVLWSNVWNWTHTGGIASRVHLTESKGLTGTTLCGKEFPAAKGHPSGYAACKACWKKAGLSAKEWRGLPYVPSTVE